MGREGIGKGLLRKAAGLMRPWNSAQGSIQVGKVIEHPHDVANPVAVFVGNGSHVGVERLRGTCSSDRRTGVEAAELNAGTEYVADQRQDGGIGDGPLKHGAFIDQVGQTPGARFELEVGTSRVALLREDFSDSLTEGGDFGVT